MKRSLLALLALGTLVLLFLLLARPETPADDAVPVVDTAPPVATPLPGYREDATPKPDPRQPARLQGRPPPTEDLTLLVRVIDPDGNAVPQAVVIVERGAGEDWGEWVETAAGGEVRVAGPTGKQTTNLDVREPADAAGTPLALLPGRVEGVRPGQDEVVVELAWSRRLSGIVRTTDGEPVAGAVLRAGPPERFSAGREAVTDEEGRFEIVGLPPGYLSARLKKNPRWVAPTMFSVEANQEELVVEVDPFVPFEVTVLGPDGEPVEGLQVRALWSMHGIGQEQTAETDAEGHVLLPSVPRSTEITVSTDWHDGAPGFPDLQVEGIPAQDGSVTIRLPEPARIEGTVLDVSGHPVAAGTVAADLIDGTGTTAHVMSTRTAEIHDGRFRLERLHAGRYRLTVWARVALGRTRPVEAVVPGPDIVIRLEPVVDLTGRVHADNLENVIVQWFSRGEVSSVLATVMQDGSFRIHGLIDAPGSLYVFDPEAGTSALLEDVDPMDGPFDVECGESLNIAGRIPGFADRRANPSLYCVRGPIERRVRIQPDGTFELQTLPPGAWRLEWHYGEHVLDGVEVEAGTLDVVFPLPDDVRGER